MMPLHHDLPSFGVEGRRDGPLYDDKLSRLVVTLGHGDGVAGTGVSERMMGYQATGAGVGRRRRR